MVDIPPRVKPPSNIPINVIQREKAAAEARRLEVRGTQDDSQGEFKVIDHAFERVQRALKDAAKTYGFPPEYIDSFDAEQ